MKTTHYKKIVLLACMATLTGSMYAQENQDLSRELTLERKYDPTVQDANKVNTLPAVREPDVKRADIEYASYAIPADPLKEINVLPSGNIMTDILYNNRKGYFNFGIGTYTNVNGDIGYHILNTEEDKLNIFFSHRSTNGKVKYLDRDQKIKAKLNDNLGGINYKHAFRSADFKLGARYGYTGFNYYGAPALNDSRVYDTDTYQGNQQIGFQAGIASHADESFEYHVGLDYTHFSRRYSLNEEYDGPKENSIGLKGGLSGAFFGTQAVGLDAILDIYTYSTPTELDELFKNYAEVTLSPYYKIKSDNLDIKLGANIMFFTGDNGKFFVSPNVTVQTEFVEKTILYLDALGRIESNSNYQLSQINRYMDPTLAVPPSRTWLDATLGVKSGVAPGFWFNIFAGYKITSDDIFFVQDFPLIQDFSSSWGNVSNVYMMNSKVFKAGLELKYAYQKYVDIYVKGLYNNWNVDSGAKAYGKPNMQFNAGADIRLVEKLTLSLDYLIAGGRHGLYYGNEVKMKNINELNPTASYAINDLLGAYIKINNVLNQKYELLPGYPLQGFSIMGGVNFNF
ncbi:MAG: TonB-dependent receptor [Tannerellaceae bacterium]|nr:TonB-dependent receptor [Tannerellaceae bacterium]